MVTARAHSQDADASKAKLSPDAQPTRARDIRHNQVELSDALKSCRGALVGVAAFSGVSNTHANRRDLHAPDI